MTWNRPSAAQSEARMRNWGIRRLRGLHAQASMLNPDRCRAVQSIIDDELRDRGAETQYERETRAMLADAMGDAG